MNRKQIDLSGEGNNSVDVPDFIAEMIEGTKDDVWPEISKVRIDSVNRGDTVVVAQYDWDGGVEKEGVIWKKNLVEVGEKIESGFGSVVTQVYVAQDNDLPSYVAWEYDAEPGVVVVQVFNP